MALIKCINCGHMISDKAVKCPKCGTPIQMIKEAAKPIEKEEKVIAEVETPKAIAKSEAVVPDEPKSQTWKKVCGIFVFAVIVIVGGYYYIQNEKSNSKSEEEIAQLNSEAFLEDGEYCYKGKWESAQHAAQPCKVEFIIKNGALIDCAYTNLKFNVRIPLKGTIEDNNLHFVSENDGKLIIELKLSDNGMMLIGEGTDYAHSGDKARLNLSKIELDAVYNEQMEAGKDKKIKDAMPLIELFINSYYDDFQGIRNKYIKWNPTDDIVNALTNKEYKIVNKKTDTIEGEGGEYESITITTLSFVINNGDKDILCYEIIIEDGYCGGINIVFHDDGLKNDFVMGARNYGFVQNNHNLINGNDEKDLLVWTLKGEDGKLWIDDDYTISIYEKRVRLNFGCI